MLYAGHSDLYSWPTAELESLVLAYGSRRRSTLADQHGLIPASGAVAQAGELRVSPLHHLLQAVGVLPPLRLNPRPKVQYRTKPLVVV